MNQLSVSQLQSLIKKSIDEAHPLPYWIMGEVSEMKVNYSGHCYLELVEKGGDNHVPKAKISAVIWRGSYLMIAPYFLSATGRELAAGMKILVKAMVTYSELYGLSLQITDIDPSYTAGDMERQRQAAIERLKQDGVYDMNRELPLPGVIQRIAAVSSRNAAGYQDFMNELSQSGYYFAVTLFDAFMQGNDAEESIIDALCRVDADAEGFDAIVVIRGGGSQSDLGAFDSYRLASYIAQFPLPVITGIGHDKDLSVADMVAAVSLKTPTAVAVFLNESLARFEATLDGMREVIVSEASTIIGNSKQRLLGNIAALGMMTSRFFTIEKNRLTNASERLKERVYTYIASRSKELFLLGRLVGSNSPERIIDLGFAVVRRDGAVIQDGKRLAAGDGIEITMRDAVVDANVKIVKTHKK